MLSGLVICYASIRLQCRRRRLHLETVCWRWQNIFLGNGLCCLPYMAFKKGKEYSSIVRVDILQTGNTALTCELYLLRAVPEKHLFLKLITIISCSPKSHSIVLRKTHGREPIPRGIPWSTQGIKWTRCYEIQYNNSSLTVQL